MARLKIVYATDEAISIEAAGDWRDLAPDDQIVAAGSDGVIDSGSPWVLTSSAIDFAAAGVVAGMMLTISLTSRSGPTWDAFAVESVSGYSVTLRRRGMDAGKGRPPFGGTGATAVVFDCRTFYPQIERKSWEINREFGIDDASTRGRRPVDLYEDRDLESYAIALVLHDLYVAQARGAQNAGEWWGKVRAMSAKIGEIKGRLSIRWNGEGDNATDLPTKPGFNAQIIR